MSIVVETRAGKLAGFEMVGKGLQAFRGIPFAAPPVGELRFAAPQDPKPWSDVREARHFGGSAPQNVAKIELLAGMTVGRQAEDCLYLNVYTPNADDARRPVMVWIHGGAFTIGSGSQAMYNPISLVTRGDMVVVTINYRLGALGFLSMGSLAPELASNMGLRDQVKALEWVRDNIAAFGGDPEQVTIFGESAGGMSVGSLLGMPSARGLFQRAIPMSGAAHACSTPDEAREALELFCEELGSAPDDVDALRAAPTDRIIEAQARCEAKAGALGRVLPFRPAVDPDSLPKLPIEGIRDGLSSDVAVMVGCTRDEWNLFALLDPRMKDIDEEQLERRVAARLPAHATARAKPLIQSYRETLKRSDEMTPLEILSAIETDLVFRVPAIRLAEAQAAHQEHTYAYLFTWESPMLGGKLGACHGVDVPFVFGAVGVKGAEGFAGAGPEADALCRDVMQAWFAFAREGKPSAEGLPAWPRYDDAARATMLLGSPCEVANAPDDGLRVLWDDIL